MNVNLCAAVSFGTLWNKIFSQSSKTIENEKIQLSKSKEEVSNSKRKLSIFNLLKLILSKLQMNIGSENELIHQNVQGFWY